MASASSAIVHLAAARVLFIAIVASLSGVAALLVFIIGRRWMRSRYFARRDALAAFFRHHWTDILAGVLPPHSLPSSPLAREVLESILLDRIQAAQGDALAGLIECLRRNGILDRRIAQARSAEGWRKQAALVVLGRTRAPEAVPALAEALDSPESETRIAAARGLGKVAHPEAAIPILERIAQERLDVPWGILKNALLSCCAKQPGILSHYLRAMSGKMRELLARVLAEVADESGADELLAMSCDPSPELRASAARGLGHLAPQIAIPPLAQLAQDAEWFVRLRAAVSLGAFVDRGANSILVRILGDRHRLVRQRSAWALIRSRQLIPAVLREIIEGGDNYGLQAVVAELDRCGLLSGVLREARQRTGDGDFLVAALERARSCLSQERPAADRVAREAVVA